MKAHPSPVRLTFRTPYFSEGWALYAEHMMREQGFFTDPRHELYQVEAMLFRAARIVVDTSLHVGDMTLEEARRFMVERANLTEPTARAEVARYAAWPTQASAYLVGCLEILAIRERRSARCNQDGHPRDFPPPRPAAARPALRSRLESAERTAPLGSAQGGACQGLGGHERADQAEGQEEVGPVAVDPSADEQKPGGGETDGT
jgi:hypothetical protein